MHQKSHYAFKASKDVYHFDLQSKLSKLDKTYVSEFEGRVKTSLAAAKLALKNAIDSQDVDAQVAAQEQIANLTVDAARLNAMKVADVEKPKEVNQLHCMPH